MRITQYRVSWTDSEGYRTEMIFEDKEKANEHIRKLLSIRTKSDRIQNVKLESRKVTTSKWKKVIKT